MDQGQLALQDLNLLQERWEEMESIRSDAAQDPHDRLQHIWNTIPRTSWSPSLQQQQLVLSHSTGPPTCVAAHVAPRGANLTDSRTAKVSERECPES